MLLGQPLIEWVWRPVPTPGGRSSVSPELLWGAAVVSSGSCFQGSSLEGRAGQLQRAHCVSHRGQSSAAARNHSTKCKVTVLQESKPRPGAAHSLWVPSQQLAKKESVKTILK